MKKLLILVAILVIVAVAGLYASGNFDQLSGNFSGFGPSNSGTGFAISGVSTPASNFQPGQQDVLLQKFRVVATEDMTLKTFEFALEANGESLFSNYIQGSPAVYDYSSGTGVLVSPATLTSGTVNFSDIKVVNLDTGLVTSFAGYLGAGSVSSNLALNTNWIREANLNGGPAGGPYTGIALTANVPVNLGVYVDIRNDAVLTTAPTQVRVLFDEALTVGTLGWVQHSDGTSLSVDEIHIKGGSFTGNWHTIVP